jgi:pyruvate dehydrogenase kinase 2/3/4
VFARKRRSTVGIKALLETGRGEYLKNFEMGLKKVDKQGTVKEKVLIQVASFLHRELPVRFAHRAIQLDAIPLLQTSKHVVEVSSWYKQSFADIRAVSPPNDLHTEELFFTVIDKVYRRHANTLLTMARGAHDIRQQHFADSEDFADFDHIQTELNNFYESRIDIRTLIGAFSVINVK